MILKKVSYILMVMGIVLISVTFYFSYKEKASTKNLIKSFNNLPLESDHKISIKEKTAVYMEGDTIGILEIPKIELEVPLIEGTTDDILNKGAGHLIQSGSLGIENENFIVAGHRAHVRGRFFNRLGEMEQGDTFLITTKREKLTYKVIEKAIILPTDFERLAPKENKTLTTLVTCHPMYSSKKRLIIVGELLE